MDDYLIRLTGLLRQGGALAPLIALIGGFLTSLNPCGLSSLPLVIGLVGAGEGEEKQRRFKRVLLFVLGMVLTFAGLGMLSAAIGRMLSFTGRWWYLVLGALMILMALETWGITQIIPKSRPVEGAARSGAAGAFFTGALAGIFASPCATPMMIALMSIVASSGHGSLYGGLLFLSYAIGHSVLTFVVGLTMNVAVVLRSSPGYHRLTRMIQILLGLLILVLGLYMLYLGF